MALFNEVLPEWDNVGIDPGGTKKTAGWLANEKPPADWFNWLFNRTYNCIAELRTIVANIATIPGARQDFAMASAPTGWLKANGAAVLVSSYAVLTTNIYCGDANNATATWGYKCTNPASPNTSRSTAGTYIVLPDDRGKHIRCFDDSAGIDSGRTLWSYQLDDNKSHTHTGTADSAGGHTHVLSIPYYAGSSGSGGARQESLQINPAYPYSANYAGDHTHNVTNANSGSTEVKVKNNCYLSCIKY